MLFLTTWPLFAMIGLGFVLARRDFPSAAFWPAAERINYILLFPALLVVSLARAPLHDPALLGMGAAAVAVILFAAAGLWLLRAVRPMPAARFGPAMQGVIRFNTYLGLSVVAMLAGAEGLERAAVYLAVAVPLVNVLSILALTDASARAPMTILRAVATNPLILACLVGFALALSGIGLPFGTGEFLAMLGQASLPLGLLCVGAALKPATLRADFAGLCGLSALRLLVMPALAALSGLIFGLSGVEALVLVVFSAMPTAPTAYVLTRQLNGDGSFMAGIVTFQTIMAALSVPLVLLVVERL
ncbi:AEC family transporter [Szabonella alba]|uniref:AEC family transporter n=1 Tax=Szabonella alba TaxID=2804194 RepID=A0A8K0XZW2_9RHOB|nr:AEC family transporter [Szabonella alba]MBL4916458.1 AEC family transporter [Szabonella alba]